MSANNLHKLNVYFKKYIDEMLINDILLLRARIDELKFSYPYILLACSCIDLFGGIEKGFSVNGRGNSECRFTWFIIEWMGRVNLVYKEQSLAYLIYDSWRCGIAHQATLKKGFETSSYMYPRDKHLYYIENNNRIFIHSLQFADDLIRAQKLYREFINSKGATTAYIDSLYSNLMSMIDENNQTKSQNYNIFVTFLKSANLVFNSTNVVPTTTTTASSVTIGSTSMSKPRTETITCLDRDILPVAPSAAPSKTDLEQ